MYHHVRFSQIWSHTIIILTVLIIVTLYYTNSANNSVSTEHWPFTDYHKTISIVPLFVDKFTIFCLNIIMSSTTSTKIFKNKYK